MVMKTLIEYTRCRTKTIVEQFWAGDFRHIPNAAELDHQERVARFYGDDRPTLRQLIDERRVEPAETVECLRFLKAMAEDPDVAEAFREILATNRLANA